jgi:hypothetical protein
MNQAHEHTRDIGRDPRNIETLQQTALSYESLGRFDEQKSMFDRVLAIVPNDPVTEPRLEKNRRLACAKNRK